MPLALAHTHTRNSCVYQEFGKFLPISCQDATCMQQVTLTLTLNLNDPPPHTQTHTGHLGLNSIFVVLHQPHCLLSHHDARCSRGYSNHALLLLAGCCLEHGQWSTEPYWPTALRTLSCAIHDPWKCVHENITYMKKRNFVWCLGCYSSDFASWISSLVVSALH